MALLVRWQPRRWLTPLAFLALAPAAGLWVAALSDSLELTGTLAMLPVPATATSRPERLLLLATFLSVMLVLPIVAVLAGALATHLLRAADHQLANHGPTPRNWWTDIQTPDPSTVSLVSDTPRPAAFEFLEYLNLIDPVTLQGPNAQTTLVGTGPFKFGEWASGDDLTLNKNASYWRSAQPYLDQVVFRIGRDPQAGVNPEVFASTTKGRGLAYDIRGGIRLAEVSLT